MPLTLYRRGKIWHYRGTVAGRLIRRSAKTESKAVARKVADAAEARAWKGHIDGPASVLTFSAAAMSYRLAGKGDDFVSKMEAHWKETRVELINPGLVEQVAMELYPNASNATRNRAVIIPTMAVINHAAKMNLCRRLSMKLLKTEKTEKAFVTLEWLDAFMAEANPHLAALACFMFGTGARVGEALALSWDDIDLRARTVRIRQTKTNTTRIAHIPARVLVALANIPGRADPVFRYTRQPARTWARTAIRAGIAPLNFHACRHGFATAMLHKGIDPVTIAERGGWASPAHVFATYGHARKDPTITEVIFGTPEAQPVERLEKSKANE